MRQNSPRCRCIFVALGLVNRFLSYLQAPAHATITPVLRSAYSAAAGAKAGTLLRRVNRWSWQSRPGEGRAVAGVVALSDSNGTCVQTYEYSVYGHVAASSLRSRATAEDGSDPNHPNPFMFTGRQFDIETGPPEVWRVNLYSYGARSTAGHTNA